MNKKTKTLILSIVVTFILLLTFTVTYAAFVYRQTGEDNHQLVLGDIYMHYTETNSGIDIDNMMPININDYTTYKVNPVMATQEVGDNELSSCVATYTGRNYQFDEGSTAESFCKGEGTAYGRTLQEDLEDCISRAETWGLDFLVEYGGQELLDAGIIIFKIENLEYFEFTISGKNTYKQKDIWYDVVLNHGDVPDGKLEENRLNDESLRFALLEVNGENQKNIFYNRSYSSLENKRIHVETISKNTTEEINKTYRLYMWIDDSVVIGNVNEDYTTDEWKDVFVSIKVSVTGDFNEKIMYTDESCFETEEVFLYGINENMTEEELNRCVTIFKDEWGYDIDEGETWESFCQGTGSLARGETFQHWIERNYSDDLNYLVSNNILIKEPNGLNIIGYNQTCGKDVVIPEVIKGDKVTTIGEKTFYGLGLHSVTIPNTVTRIEYRAFKFNNILEVTIPDSVTHLDCEAFDESVNIIKNENLVCFKTEM